MYVISIVSDRPGIKLMKLDNKHIVEIVVPHFTTNICVTRHIPARQTDLPDLPDISGHAVQNLVA